MLVFFHIIFKITKKWLWNDKFSHSKRSHWVLCCVNTFLACISKRHVRNSPRSKRNGSPLLITLLYVVSQARQSQVIFLQRLITYWLPNVIWDTSSKSQDSSFLAWNANANPSSETSQPLVITTSLLTWPFRGLTYSTQKFMGSTCGKSTIRICINLTLEIF